MKPHPLRRRSSDFMEERKIHYPGSWLNKPISISVLPLLLPIFLVNGIIAIIKKKPIFIVEKRIDALGRKAFIHTFSEGIFKKSAIIIDIITGSISLCGASLDHRIEQPFKNNLLNNYAIPAGIFSLYDLHISTGLCDKNHGQLLEEQANGTSFNFISLLVKSILCKFFYENKHNKLKSPTIFTVFGIRINNIKMKEAINWIVSEKNQKTKIGFFVNVNSINLSSDKPELKQYLLNADRVFADGSGIRLAAKHIGVKLKDNVNGTDLLPHLCKTASKKRKSLYFIGSEPGVAKNAAKKLQIRYPSLNIAGVQHGYFDQHEHSRIIENINSVSPDILLVALGSPIQEQWVIENAEKLNCNTILAVGGLLDFYSGKIPRAPLWMREIGMEWVWRLLQEPKSKFKRYVIGNPIFLFRTFVLNQA